MQVKIEEQSKLGRIMHITVPAADVEERFNAKLTQMTKNVKIDGFRPGKAPQDVMKQRFGQQVLNELQEDLVNNFAPKAMVEHKVNPAGQPELKAEQAPAEGADYTFQLVYDIFPEIKPSGYDKLKLDKQVAETSDEMLEEGLKRIRGMVQTFSAKDGAAAMGDRVVFDGHGYKEGEDEPFEGGHLHGHKVTLGEKSLIPGFEEALVGLSVGEEKSFNVTFPDDYFPKEMASVKARFEVKVTEVLGADELDDTKLAEQLGAKDIDGLKEQVTARISKDIEEASRNALKKDLFDKLLDKNDFDLPERLVSSEFAALWGQQVSQLQQQGLPIEALGNVDEARAEYRQLAERRVKLGLLLAEIGIQEKIEVTEEEIQQSIDQQVAQAGAQGEQVRAYYNEPRNRQNLGGPLLEEKVVDWILEKATVSDKKVDAKELLQA